MSRQIRRNGVLVAGHVYDVVVTSQELTRLQAAAKRAKLSKGELVAKMLEAWEREEERQLPLRAGAQ